MFGVCSDLSMILCDPHAVHTLAMSATQVLQHAASTEALPRVSHMYLPHMPLSVSNGL